MTNEENLKTEPQPLVYYDLNLRFGAYDEAASTFKVWIEGDTQSGGSMSPDDAVERRFEPGDFWDDPQTATGGLLEKLERRELSDSEFYTLGQRLADLALPPGDVRDLFEQNVQFLNAQEGLRLRLRIDSNELAQLPWEYMALRQASGRQVATDFLALRPEISIVRTPTVETPARTLPKRDAAQVVAVLSNPTDQEQLDAVKEQQAIEGAVRALDRNGAQSQIKLTWAASPATRKALEDALANGADIFHFAGHAQYEAASNRGLIVLERADRTSDYYEGEQLAALLRGKGVRLAVLGACETARQMGQDSWSGAAQVLTREKIPAVLANQLRIEDQNAAALTETLYRSLLAGETVDQALSRARRMLYQRKGLRDRDWGVPVLYLQGKSGVLFPLPHNPVLHYPNLLWLKYLRPVYDRLSLGDKLVGGVLLPSLILYFGWFWRAYFNFQEKALWGALLLLVALSWLLLRRVSWRRKEPSESAVGAKRVSLRSAFALLALLLPFWGGWGYAVHLIYHLPAFSTETRGFYVARFANDPSDVSQEAIYDGIGKAIKGYELTGVEVKKLPRRVADEETAKQLAKSGHALLILHGAVNAQGVDSYLTIVGARAIYSKNVPIGGISAFSVDPRTVQISAELKKMQVVLPIFFVGYHKYHTEDYQGALSHFITAKAELEQVTKAQEGVTLEKATLGSIRFYIGRTYHRLRDILIQNRGGEDAQAAAQREASIEEYTRLAMEEYRAAIEVTARPIEITPRYLEPLNNLGYLLMDQGKYDEAIARFRQAARICQSQGASMNCATVSYNSGLAEIWKSDYRQANGHFEQAINLFNAVKQNPQDEELDYTFLAYAFQNAAYCHVKLGNLPDARQSQEHYRLAEENLDRAVAAMKTVTQSDDRPDFDILRGRIYIGYRRWDEAVKVLEEARQKIDDPRLDLLLGTAYHCKKGVDERDETENIRKRDEHLKKFFELSQLSFPSKNPANIRRLIALKEDETFYVDVMNKCSLGQ